MDFPANADTCQEINGSAAAEGGQQLVMMDVARKSTFAFACVRVSRESPPVLLHLY